MNKGLAQYILIFSLALLASCKQGSKTQCTVNGTIEGIVNDKLLLLTNTTEMKVDTIEIKNGKFSFTKPLKEMAIFQIMLESNGAGAFLVAEPGTLTVKAKATELDKLTVKGSDGQKQFNEFLEALTPVNKSIEEITLKAQSSPEGNYEQEMAAVIQQKNTILEQHIKKYSSSVLSAGFAYDASRNDTSTAQIEKWLGLLTGAASKSTYAQAMREQIISLRGTVKLGSMATDFTLSDVNAKAFKLSSLKGKYVLLDFWATWCGPCKKELPNVQAAYEKYKDKGLEIVGISIDEDTAAWQAFLQQNNYSWIQVNEPPQRGIVATNYGIRAIPSNFLLDKEGKVIATNLIGAALDEALAKVMP